MYKPSYPVATGAVGDIGAASGQSVLACGFSFCGHLQPTAPRFPIQPVSTRIDVMQLARRDVLVEETVEVDLVANTSNFLVLVVAEGFVNVGVRQMRRTSRAR